MSTAVVTPEFIDRIIRSGELSEAWYRLHQGMAKPRNQAHWHKFSSWCLICEEVIDTEHDSDWYDDILAELLRRGFDFDQINQMRRFAWKTAGWLNYDKMLWEWVRLDEQDIRKALGWQLEEGVISLDQHSNGLFFLDHPEGVPSSE